jgi:hypothetical protein
MQKGLLAGFSTFVVKTEDALTGMIKAVMHDATTMGSNVSHDVSTLGSNVSWDLNNMVMPLMIGGVAIIAVMLLKK